jgi:exodeoxyribonuclease VII large subunit
VTSPTGAVIRDMLAGFAERFPTRVIVWPVRVQGEGSAAEVAGAIRGFNNLPEGGRIPRPDVLIVARGGGSLEDLWGFNDEQVVRAVAESRIPLISAVGHETDTTLIDHAADARAPTPTKAAEWAVPKYSELIETLGSLAVRHGSAIRRLLEARRIELKSVARGLPRPADLVAGPRQRFDLTSVRLTGALAKNTSVHARRLALLGPRLSLHLLARRIERARDRLQKAHQRSGQMLARLTGKQRARFERASGRHSPTVTLARCRQGRERLTALGQRSRRALDVVFAQYRRALEARAGLLQSLSYQSVLRRGFALIRDAEGRSVTAEGVEVGSTLDIEVADGRIAAQVLAQSPAKTDAVAARPAANPAAPRTARPPRSSGGGSTGGGQGRLF